jgi:hypothetical protein
MLGEHADTFQMPTRSRFRPPKVTVEKTVKPLKMSEKAGISEHNKNDARRLKRLEQGLGQAERESER